MDESRKQFLEWFGEEFESINNSEELHVQAIKMIAWQSWVKSRAAIEIKLDDKVMAEDDFDKGHNCAIDYCADSIRAAGIKVKE
ncbi:hypothetical protein D5C54_21080 [Salmonella enterica subsp. enterica serovar Typhimurium]|nr:hypothetical protein [Salmonella enterica subsp. enterica serovar Typhimurium]EBJ1612800.1 hypothetical protein [Salmonella enterica]EEO3116566.1 hypothetical protein [Salmonella enterica subsp. enterica]EBU9263815.1 hypothetical protein [Salmonella enterica subsp. enterica serovar Typhimurium]EBW0811053.1 hypothetical protein [Salmonella enterica subsp. enterica serovar Typhimurium]